VRRAISAAVGAAAGALLLHPGPPTVASWLILAAAVVAAAGLVGWRRGSEPAFIAALGMAAVACRLAIAPGALLVDRPLPTGDGPWTAVVESLSPPRDGQQIATIHLSPDGPRVAGTLPRYPVIEPGSAIVVSGSLRPPPDDSYGDYLRRIGVAATLRSRSITLEQVPAAGVSLETLRRGAATALTRAIPEPEAGLAAGILIGLRDRVDRRLAGDFTTAGTSHVVAISGWNIAIVAASVAALGGRLARRRRSLLTSLAIAVYVVFVGASASVLRAGAMAGVVLLARESGRAGRAAAALGWAAVILLLVDPGLVRDAGFQLSTLATGGLILWATPLTERIRHIHGHALPGWLAEGLGVSLAAQAATLPLVLASFGRLSVVAPVVNLAVVPLVTPAMAFGAVALVVGAISLIPGAPVAIATIGGLPAWGVLAVIVGVVRAFAPLPLASLTLEPPAALVAAVVATGVLVVAGTGRVRRAVGRLARRGAAVQEDTRPAPRAAVPVSVPGTRTLRFSVFVLIGAVVLGGLVVVHRPDGRTTIVVLDVGQGDAILLEGSRGGRLLIDGGPDPDRLLVALDERLPPWDHRFDAVILTHPHEDHVAGLALLLERYRVGRLFEPGMHGGGPGYAAWARRLSAMGVRTARLSTGNRLMVDDARLSVLWPDAGTVPSEPANTGKGVNNVSIVLLGEVADRRFLLAGDIEQEIDPTILARGLPRVDMLKVAHHGSGTATTDAFLDAVRPSVAVVSAGAGNPYGHPNARTLERIAGHGARVLRTDSDGTVEVAIGDGRFSVRAAGAHERRVATTAGRPPKPPLRPAFTCAVPLSPGGRTASSSGAAPRPSPARPAALYHPPDDGPRADRRRSPPPDPRSPSLVRAAFAGRRGSRGLARVASQPERRAGGPAARRVGCAAPRRRQALAGFGPRPPPAARRSFRCLAHEAGSRRARASCRGASGDAPCGRRVVPGMDPVGEPRGADPGLRRQACQPAPRVTRRAIRRLGTALSGR
jgi:competence protein ComEC